MTSENDDTARNVANVSSSSDDIPQRYSSLSKPSVDSVGADDVNKKINNNIKTTSDITIDATTKDKVPILILDSNREMDQSEGSKKSNTSTKSRSTKQNNSSRKSSGTNSNAQAINSSNKDNDLAAKSDDVSDKRIDSPRRSTICSQNMTPRRRTSVSPKLTTPLSSMPASVRTLRRNSELNNSPLRLSARGSSVKVADAIMEHPHTPRRNSELEAFEKLKQHLPQLNIPHASRHEMMASNNNIFPFGSSTLYYSFKENPVSNMSQFTNRDYVIASLALSSPSLASRFDIFQIKVKLIYDSMESCGSPNLRSSSETWSKGSWIYDFHGEFVVPLLNETLLKQLQVLILKCDDSNEVLLASTHVELGNMTNLDYYESTSDGVKTLGFKVKLNPDSITETVTNETNTSTKTIPSTGKITLVFQPAKSFSSGDDIIMSDKKLHLYSTKSLAVGSMKAINESQLSLCSNGKHDSQTTFSSLASQVKDDSQRLKAQPSAMIDTHMLSLTQEENKSNPTDRKQSLQDRILTAIGLKSKPSEAEITVPTKPDEPKPSRTSLFGGHRQHGHG